MLPKKATRNVFLPSKGDDQAENNKILNIHAVTSGPVCQFTRDFDYSVTAPPSPGFIDTRRKCRPCLTLPRCLSWDPKSAGRNQARSPSSLIFPVTPKPPPPSHVTTYCQHSRSRLLRGKLVTYKLNLIIVLRAFASSFAI